MPPSDNNAPADRRIASASRRRRQLGLQRGLAITALAGAVIVIALLIAALFAPARVPRVQHRAIRSGDRDTATMKHMGPARSHPVAASPAGSYGVGVTTLHLVDHTRTIKLPGGQTVPRPVTTVVLYPTVKTSIDLSGARRAHLASGRFPLIVFGHGFDILPGVYSRLLRYWTSAGFIVAAPIFPLENANAPGGPNESDLPNQPADMRFVIASLEQLSRSPHGTLSGHVNATEVAVAGHSDGGDTALALAYDPSLRDAQLAAAMILSGAEIPMLPAFKIARGGPPLLATQGTADTINLPSATAAFFDTAPPPKYLLQLPGESHIGPYTTDKPQLSAVERVTTAFLQYYLEHHRAGMAIMSRAGNVRGISELQAHP